MMGPEQILEFGRKAIWNQDLTALPAWKNRGLRALRTGYRVFQDLWDGDLPLRAMSLVYTTLMSLVPLLAVSFSVLKGFGVHNQIEPLLLQFLAPLGEKGIELSDNIIGFVENMKVGVLGGLGMGLLVYTVVSLVQKIEKAFNFTWHTTQTRSLGRRFSDYLSVIMIGPLLMFAAIGLTGTIMSNSIVQTIVAIEPFGSALELGTRVLPFLFVIAAFTFVYTFVPNTRVAIGSALVGAIVAGTLWQTAGLIFAALVSGSAKYTAIYSGFAILFVFMIWLYYSWLILLIGASIAFYHQHPEYLVSEQQSFDLSSRVKEKLALMVAYLVGRGHLQGRAAWTLEDLAQRAGLPLDAIGGVVAALEGRQLLTKTADEPPGYLPARALESIRVLEVLEAVRSAEDGVTLDAARLSAEQPVEHVIEGVERAYRDSLASLTLHDMVSEDSAPSA